MASLFGLGLTIPLILLFIRADRSQKGLNAFREGGMLALRKVSLSPSGAVFSWEEPAFAYSRGKDQKN